MRRKYDDNFKSKVAIEAMQNTMTLAELASKYKVHPNMITQWTKHLVDHAYESFYKKKELTSLENMLKTALPMKNFKKD